MNGFLNINKEAGWTSHDVVAKVRRLLKIQKVGHGGALDPQATGVLPICLGKATRLSEFFLYTDKLYRVVMKLGVVTDTQDAQGQVLSRTEAVSVSAEAVKEVLKGFVGSIQQVPPMYSAVKVKGQPLYKMARKGQEIERPAREVTIYSLDVLEVCGDEVTFDVTCSRGTYIRTLCADAGERLGVGGHCLKLERRRCGPFRIEEAITLEKLEAAIHQGSYSDLVYDMGEVLGHLPALSLRAGGMEKALHGVPLGCRDVQIPGAAYQKGDLFRVVKPDGGLVALARASGDIQDPLFKIEKVLIQAQEIGHGAGLASSSA